LIKNQFHFTLTLHLLSYLTQDAYSVFEDINLNRSIMLRRCRVTLSESSKLRQSLRS